MVITTGDQQWQIITVPKFEKNFAFSKQQGILMSLVVSCQTFDFLSYGPALAKPKSEILQTLPSLTRTFLAAKSR